MKASAVTFDLDWAPDWCIELCISLCRQSRVPATFFVTHKTSILDAISGDDLFELGIHPNFLSGSSQGSSHREVLDHCMALVPEARAMRSHDLYQCSRLYHLIAESYPSIGIDLSLFLPWHQELQPVDIYSGRNLRRIVRLPFFWADDIAGTRPDWSWTQAPPTSNGLSIFVFHPVHVALNTDNLKPYEALKSALGERKLHEATVEEFGPYVNSGDGTLDFLNRLLTNAPPEGFQKISDIADARQ